MASGVRVRVRVGVTDYSCSVLFLLIVIYLVFPFTLAHSKCKKSFSCGNLGILEFPFSDNKECGLFTIVNCSLPEPLLVLGDDERAFFHVHNKSSPNKIFVTDFVLRDLLKANSCVSFGIVNRYNSPSIRFAVSPNITLFSCRNNLSVPANKITHKYFRGCRNYKACKIYEDLYYGEPPKVCSMEESGVPENCSILHMPTYHHEKRGPADDLFQLLNATFQLEWHISRACISCHRRGGMCLDQADHKFRCKESKRRKVILASAISASTAAFLGFFFAISFLIFRWKKTKDAHLLSRNNSSACSSKSDLEVELGFGIPIFSYQELEEATNNFHPSTRLGDGGFGTVYYGELRDGREVAIKRLYEHNYKRVEQFINEIKILSGLRHPNLVSLYGCTSRRSRELLLVYEYIANGTVADHLHGEMAHKSLLTWPVRLNIAIETASALAYLHSSDIIHRDVKTNNLLLDKNFSVKAADFGLSRLFPDDVSHISTAPQGTPGYVDPEYHQCYQLTDKSDVYSFGVVLIELISSLPAVDITRHRQEINLSNLAMERIQRGAFDELIDSSLGYQSDAEVARMTTSVAELAFRCLQLEQELRPSMDEVLASLKDIKAGDLEDCLLEETQESDVIKYFFPSNDEVSSTPNMKSSPAVTVTDTWTRVGITTRSSTI